MEIRIEKKKKYPFPDRRKLHKIWKILLAGLVICLLVGGMVWQLGRRATAQAEGENKYNMDTVTVTENGVTKTKYVFNVVEVVPQKSQAILGLFISGQEDKIIPVAEIQSFVKNNETYKEYDYNKLFYFWNKNGDGSFSGKEASTGVEPFTVEKETGLLKNNEIFKLYMLGIGNIDSNLSTSENLVKNKDVLGKFDAQFQISYQIVTPEQLTSDMVRHTQYLHIGSGWQIQGINNLYKRTGHNDLAESGSQKFVTDITSFSIVDEIYQRAISKNDRLSISINSYPFWNDNNDGKSQTYNIYKLYRMLNHFDDTGKFKEFYKDGELGKGNSYIDKQTGDIINGANRYSSWNEHYLNLLSNSHNYPTASYYSARPGNYIPENYDNILLYNSQGGVGGAGFFESRENIRGTSGSGGDINSILNFNKYKPSDTPEPQDIEVKVLEIEPCTDFRFQNNEAEQLKFAEWLNVSSNSIEYTFVTPNELNGMTVDIISEYDIVYIGDRVGKLGGGTSYHNQGTSRGYPYQHIGSLEDSAITNTLVNGLLSKDMTNSAAFKELAGKEIKGSPIGSFLRNVDIEIELGQKLDLLGHARFSGNDVTGYMKEQLKDYVNSGLPVVVAPSIIQISQDLATDLKKTKPSNAIDGNIYAVFAETIFADKALGKYNNIYQDESYASGDIHLLKDDKPKLEVIDTRANDEQQYILKNDGEGPKNLSMLEKSNELQFGYKIELSKSDEYTMKVIIDQNGDGIFDEPKEQSKLTSGIVENNDERQDIVYSQTLNGLSPEGIFTTPGPIHSVKEICQFRVIIETKESKLRTSWTGYMRSDLSQNKVKILQIMSDESDSAIVAHEEFKTLVEMIDSPEYEFDFKEGIDTVTVSEFENDFTDKNALDGYNLIIVGFDFGTHFTDIESDALKVLQQYIAEKKKPVIFTKDSISYVNTGYYRAPEEVNYAWVKMTVGDVAQIGGESNLKEGENYRRKDLTKEEYQRYVEANKEIKNDKDKIFLEALSEKEVGAYKAIFLPVTENKISDGRENLWLNLGYSGKILGVVHEPWRALKSDNTFYYLTPKQIKNVLEYKGYETSIDESGFWVDYYDLNLGWITKDEFNTSYQDISTQFESPCYKNNTVFSRTYSKNFILRDLLFYTNMEKTKTISESYIVKGSNFEAADGKTYYLHHGQYLARKVEGETVPEEGSAYWEKKVIINSGTADDKSYQLAPVAGKSNALYPEKVEWGYNMSQDLRMTLGMDRFGITRKIDDKEESRDTGTTRKNKKIPEEIQGFTNGLLLEYSANDTQGGYPGVQPYSDSTVKLGTAPRTTAIEMMNEGVISGYPFKIETDEMNRLTVEENHAPYYQLDLERSLNKNKTDDITVWYTFSGTPEISTTNSNKVTLDSNYFELTRRDAGNNYYLYSKGNVFYTAYNLPDKSVTLSDAQVEEMKLFINTIYAALSSGSIENASYYNTQVKNDGAVSQLNISDQIGVNNEYVCYYDESDKSLTLQFCVQKQGGQDSEPPIRVAIGFKDGTTAGIKLPLFSPSEYILQDGLSLDSFPVKGINSEQATVDGENTWYRIEIPFAQSDENALSQDSLDGQTLLLAAMVDSIGNTVIQDAIHAEIHLVRRNLFNLD